VSIIRVRAHREARDPREREHGSHREGVGRDVRGLDLRALEGERQQNREEGERLENQQTPPSAADTYCPAPHDQFVVQWNGDVVSCCTDYEGLTKTANVFASSVEDVWRGRTRRGRLKDMLEGRLLDVCARCQGLK